MQQKTSAQCLLVVTLAMAAWTTHISWPPRTPAGRILTVVDGEKIACFLWLLERRCNATTFYGMRVFVVCFSSFTVVTFFEEKKKAKFPINHSKIESILSSDPKNIIYGLYQVASLAGTSQCNLIVSASFRLHVSWQPILWWYSRKLPARCPLPSNFLWVSTTTWSKCK